MLALGLFGERGKEGPGRRIPRLGRSTQVGRGRGSRREGRGEAGGEMNRVRSHSKDGGGGNRGAGINDILQA